jgi:hypothetical protein
MAKIIDVEAIKGMDLQARKQFLATQPKSAMPGLSAPKRTAHERYVLVSWGVFFGCLATLIFGITHGAISHEPSTIYPYPMVDVPTVSPLVGWSIALFCAYWFIVGMFFYLRGMNHQFDLANAPLPSLQEIAAHLRDEGFDPSIADCIALQNQLKLQKIEHGVAFGAMMVGPSILAHQAKGGKIL